MVAFPFRISFCHYQFLSGQKNAVAKFIHLITFSGYYVHYSLYTWRTYLKNHNKFEITSLQDTCSFLADCFPPVEHTDKLGFGSFIWLALCWSLVCNTFISVGWKRKHVILRTREINKIEHWMPHCRCSFLSMLYSWILNHTETYVKWGLISRHSLMKVFIKY